MTREEAKKLIFSEWQSFLEHNIDYAGISEAYKMAIKALEQEPCDDAISRKAVIRITAETGALETQGRVKALPSVTPKQKMGRWIIDREVVDKSRKPTTYHFDTHCSECGFKNAYTTDIEDSIPTNYCPNCGAKMAESEE